MLPGLLAPATAGADHPVSVEALSLVLHHSGESGTRQLVLIGIANHDGDGGAWPTIDTLARYAGVTGRNVQKAIDQLEAAGKLRVELQGGGTRDWADNRRPNRYVLMLMCPTDCDGSKHHRTRRNGRHDPLPIRGVGSDTPPADRGVGSDVPRGVGSDTQTIHTTPPPQVGLATTDRARGLGVGGYCRTHPGGGTRVDGTCGGCWADAHAVDDDTTPAPVEPVEAGAGLTAFRAVRSQLTRSEVTT